MNSPQMLIFAGLSCILLVWGILEKRNIDARRARPNLKVNGMIVCGGGGFIVWLFLIANHYLGFLH